MITTSADFLAAARATIRKPKVKLQICWTDPYIETAISASANDDNRISYPNQVADLIETVPYKYAHFVNFPLDGTIHPAPGTAADARSYQMGWWGNTQADASGVFSAPYPTLTLLFASRPVYALRVVGNSAYNEYPVDFNVYIYEGPVLLATVNVTGNDSLTWTYDVSASGITDANKMILEITKWSAANEIVKVSEFYTSIIEDYYGDDIISLNLLEEMEIRDGSLPIGNISANELDIRLQNLEDKFFPGNTANQLHALIKNNRRVTAWLGFVLPDGSADVSSGDYLVETDADGTKIGYVPLGVFWSGDWDVPESGTYAATSCRDRMEQLRKRTFSSGTVYENYTLYALAEVVMEAAKVEMPDLEYSIDTELQDYSVRYAYLSEKSYRETLRDIVGACMGQAYCDRSGVVQIIGPSMASEQAAAESAYKITRDEYFTKNQPAKSEELANFIEVTTQPLVLATVPEEVYSSEEISLEGGESKTFTCKYTDAPVMQASASITESSSEEISLEGGESSGANITVSAATYYAWGAEVTVTNNSLIAGTCILVIEAKKLTVEGEEVITSQDQDSINKNGLLKYTFPNNHLVQSRSMAQSIADALLAAYKTPRKDVSLDWICNPALELTDPIEVPEYQKNGIDQKGTFYITKNSLQFTGSLRAKTDGRKVS